MSKAVKEMIMQELRTRYAGIDSACVVDMTGMNVQQQQRLRRLLRERSARLEVVKNSLARRAFSDGPLAPLGEALQGPCALVTSKESLVEAAKALVEAAKEFETLTLKHAILEGDPELVTVEQLAKMKSRAELIGEVIMLVTSPARRLAGCLTGPPSRIAGCLKTLAEREGANN